VWHFRPVTIGQILADGPRRHVGHDGF
jgi:hypothetical protein